MNYVVYCEHGYIVSVGCLNVDSKFGKTITESEYEGLLKKFLVCPTAPDGFAYRLTAELEWELYEAPVEEIVNTELTEIEEKAKAYDILMGKEE